MSAMNMDGYWDQKENECCGQRSKKASIDHQCFENANRLEKQDRPETSLDFSHGNLGGCVGNEQAKEKQDYCKHLHPSDVWYCCNCGCQPSSPHRRWLAKNWALILSLFAGGWATAGMIDFHHSLSVDSEKTHDLCGRPELSWPWFPPVSTLLQKTTCPPLIGYYGAMIVYSAVGLSFLLHPPRFWADFAWVTLALFALIAVWRGSTVMLVDGVVLSGFLSLGLSWICDHMRDKGQE